MLKFLEWFLAITILGGIVSIFLVAIILAIPFFVLGYLGYLTLLFIEKIKGTKNE